MDPLDPLDPSFQRHHTMDLVLLDPWLPFYLRDPILWDPWDPLRLVLRAETQSILPTLSDPAHPWDPCILLKHQCLEFLLFQQDQVDLLDPWDPWDLSCPVRQSLLLREIVNGYCVYDARPSGGGSLRQGDLRPPRSAHCRHGDSLYTHLVGDAGNYCSVSGGPDF